MINYLSGSYLARIQRKEMLLSRNRPACIVVPPVLYSYFRSSCSWRVRIALDLKGINYEYRAVNLEKDGGEQMQEKYSHLNPKMEVPTLVIDGHTIFQSLPIIEYIEETRPQEPNLLPKDPITRAKVRSLAEVINSGIQPIQTLQLLKYVGNEKKMEFAKYFIKRGFQALEKMLATTAGKYSVGDSISIADLCLVPQVFNAKRFKVDMNEFPIISRINADLLQLDAVKSAHPSQQPDSQPDSPDDFK